MAHQRVLFRSGVGIADPTRAMCVEVSGAGLLTGATTMAELPAPNGEAADPPEAP